MVLTIEENKMIKQFFYTGVFFLLSLNFLQAQNLQKNEVVAFGKIDYCHGGLQFDPFRVLNKRQTEIKNEKLKLKKGVYRLAFTSLRRPNKRLLSFTLASNIIEDSLINFKDKSNLEVITKRVKVPANKIGVFELKKPSRNFGNEAIYFSITQNKKSLGLFGGPEIDLVLPKSSQKEPVAAYTSMNIKGSDIKDYQNATIYFYSGINRGDFKKGNLLSPTIADTKNNVYTFFTQMPKFDSNVPYVYVQIHADDDVSGYKTVYYKN